jgi:hypothetical protein
MQGLTAERFNHFGSCYNPPTNLMRNQTSTPTLSDHLANMGRLIMGRGILLWLLGVPIPIIILLALVWH